MSSIKKKFLHVILLLSLSFYAFASSIDDRLVGNWQGQRNPEGKCSFLAWKMSRTADGKFEIIFFGDAEKTLIQGQAKGLWKTADGKISLFFDGVTSPDIYTYNFTDNNSVKLSNIKRDPSADCMADYEFTDHRMNELQVESSEQINALWNDSSSDRTIAFWLYSTTGICPSIRRNPPIVFASKRDLAGEGANEVSVKTLSYCFELYPKTSRIGGNSCESGSVSYTYLPEQNRYSGKYKFQLSDGTVMEGKFLAEYCPKSDTK